MRQRMSWPDTFICLMALMLAMFGWWLVQLAGDVRALREEVASTRSAILTIDDVTHSVQRLDMAATLHEERLALLKDQVIALMAEKLLQESLCISSLNCFGHNNQHIGIMRA